MEIKLLQKESPVWVAGDPIHQQVSFHAEAVVPDTAEDVQEIVWTRGGLLLKGKEPGLHAASVTGEAWASVLYLTENGQMSPEFFEMVRDYEEKMKIAYQNSQLPVNVDHDKIDRMLIQIYESCVFCR